MKAFSHILYEQNRLNRSKKIIIQSRTHHRHHPFVSKDKEGVLPEKDHEMASIAVFVPCPERQHAVVVFFKKEDHDNKQEQTMTTNRHKIEQRLKAGKRFAILHTTKKILTKKRTYCIQDDRCRETMKTKETIFSGKSIKNCRKDICDFFDANFYDVKTHKRKRNKIGRGGGNEKNKTGKNHERKFFHIYKTKEEK